MPGRTYAAAGQTVQQTSQAVERLGLALVVLVAFLAALRLLAVLAVLVILLVVLVLRRPLVGHFFFGQPYSILTPPKSLPTMGRSLKPLVSERRPF